MTAKKQQATKTHILNKKKKKKESVNKCVHLKAETDKSISKSLYDQVCQAQKESENRCFQQILRISIKKAILAPTKWETTPVNSN